VKKKNRFSEFSSEMLTFSFLIEGVCLPTVSSFGLIGKHWTISIGQ
jgi:hypothetical protein